MMPRKTYLYGKPTLMVIKTNQTFREEPLPAGSCPAVGHLRGLIKKCNVKIFGNFQTVIWQTQGK